MKQLLIITLLLLTGCTGLTNYATDFLKEMQDSNRYEEVRDTVKSVCADENYEMYVNRYGKDIFEKMQIEACSPVARKKDPKI